MSRDTQAQTLTLGCINDPKYPGGQLSFRRKPAGVVESDLAEGSLNLKADCALAASVSQGPFKFTVTSPYMLARSVLDNHYHNFETLTMALASGLPSQGPGLPCACLQVGGAAGTGLGNDKTNYTGREPAAAQAPALRVVGKKEAESHSVSVRRLGSDGQKVLPTAEAIAALVEEATPPDVKRANG